jgi:integrase
MKAALETTEQPTVENIVPLTLAPKPRPATTEHRTKFNILEFTNRSGSQSWRVSGYKRDGSRVRENFSSVEAAQCRQMDLESEYLQRQTETAVRATKLSDEQIRLAETAFAKLDSNDELLSCVDYWLKHGRANAVPESPLLDEAVPQFLSWVESSNLRPTTKNSLRIRLNVFANSVPNLRVADIGPDVIEGFLDGRKISNASKINDKTAVSSFFTWAINRKRRWAMSNPCAVVEVERDQKPPPRVLAVDDCRKLLKATQAHKDGRLLPYVSMCLFGGLRPSEASRLTWQQVNLADNEIRLEAHQTKVGKPRVVAICPTLRVWLRTCKGMEFWPANAPDDLREIKRQIGFGNPTKEEPNLKPWIDDVLRHTAISHHFRLGGSYGRTAEWAGNSEQVIREHYQGRVSTEDTKRFYAILPVKGGAK